MTTLQGSCHCGAVRFEVEEPEWVMDCNCSRCRLYGGLWAYYAQRDVKFVAEPDTFIYMWGDRMLEFHHCRTCGCHTHSTEVGTDDAEKNRRKRPSVARHQPKTHTACSEKQRQ